MDHGIPRSWSDETLPLPGDVPELSDPSSDTHTVDEPLHAGSPFFVGGPGQSMTDYLQTFFSPMLSEDIPAAQREPEIPADQPERDQEQPEIIALPEHEPKPVAAKANAKAKAKPLAGKAKANANAEALPVAAKAKAKAKALALPAKAAPASAAKAKAKAKANALAVPVAPPAKAAPSASAAKAKAKAKAKVVHVPLCAAKANAKAPVYRPVPPDHVRELMRTASVDIRRTLYHEWGCTKCRWAPGCTPSCWTARNVSP